ncbi:MAG: TlpA family protein disulfide reductase [Spirochaetia bacterium]|nr:TlpA family protein disulfide reductase [Spirochaetia bacterium]
MLSFFLVFFTVTQQWQTRNLLQKRVDAPELKLHSIDGKEYSIANFRGKQVVLYFFAPWCSVCKLTSGNIETLQKYSDPKKLQILIVGLAYDEPAEIAQFQKNHDLTAPVLIGNEALANAYQISGFPVFYFIDEDGKIKSSSIGYTSTPGLFWRSM